MIPNVTNPEPFTANGSRAKHLALILNRYEAKTLSGQSELSDREHAEFLYESGHAEVIIIKQGPAGALICDKGKISYIPLPMRQVGSTKLDLVTHS
ncbi:PfkB family carbohydrate kinase [Klebsiella quasipneumoniae]|uniref:PfkB family carbohydrate kinase n=1 Tax=Klebsiella quasipneumoniae TaxID=1463165 RepID=UPI00389065F6